MNLFSESMYKPNGNYFYLDAQSISKETKPLVKSFILPNNDLTKVYKQAINWDEDKLKIELNNKTVGEKGNLARSLRELQVKIEKREQNAKTFLSRAIIAIYNFAAAMFGFKPLDVIAYDAKKLTPLIALVNPQRVRYSSHHSPSPVPSPHTSPVQIPPPPVVIPGLDTAAAKAELKAKLDAVLAQPPVNQNLLSALLLKAISEVVVKSASPDEVIATVAEALQGAQTRFDSRAANVTEKLQEMAMTDAITHGNTELAAKVIKQVDPLLAPWLKIEHIPNLIKLSQVVPSQNALQTFTKQLGQEFLKGCEHPHLLMGNPEKLNQALISLQPVYPQEIEALQIALAKQINLFTDHQYRTIYHAGKATEWQGKALAAIVALFGFLEKEDPQVADFIACLEEIGQKVPPKIKEMKQQDLLLHAYVDLVSALLLRAGDKIREKLDLITIDYQEGDTHLVNQLQELLASIPPRFDTEIAFEVQMEVENDDLMGSLAQKFPDLEVAEINEFVHTLIAAEIDRDFFAAWLSERFPTYEVSTLNNLLIEFQVTQSMIQRLPHEEPGVISAWIYDNVIEHQNLETFQGWWEANKQNVNALGDL